MSRGWLLVSFPGPWPNKPWLDNPIDPEAGRQIELRAKAEQIKPWFIRRHGTQYAPQAGTFEWAVVDAHSRQIQWRSPAHLSDIASAQWLPDQSVGTTATDNGACEPLYLVCTHGRRDQCCATRGRPVAAAAQALAPEVTWECSHVGGHRLAGNFVVLPYGLYYGLVDPADVPAIITATTRNEVHLPLLRGTATDAPPVQAAKNAARTAGAGLGIDALQTLAVQQRSDSEWSVVLGTNSGETWDVTVARMLGPDAPETCGAQPVPTTSWHARLGG